MKTSVTLSFSYYQEQPPLPILLRTQMTFPQPYANTVQTRMDTTLTPVYPYLQLDSEWKAQ